MATIAPSNSDTLLQSLDTDPIENAWADLEIARVFLDTCDPMLGGIRTMVEALGHDSKNFRDLYQVDIMLCEIKTKVEDAQANAHKALEELMAAKRAAKA